MCVRAVVTEDSRLDSRLCSILVAYGWPTSSTGEKRTDMDRRGIKDQEKKPRSPLAMTDARLTTPCSIAWRMPRVRADVIPRSSAVKYSVGTFIILLFCDVAQYTNHARASAEPPPPPREAAPLRHNNARLCTYISMYVESKVSC